MGLVGLLLLALFWTAFFMGLYSTIWPRLSRDERRWLFLGRSRSASVAIAGYVLGLLSFVLTGWLLRLGGFVGAWYTEPATSLAFAAILIGVFAVCQRLAFTS